MSSLRVRLFLPIGVGLALLLPIGGFILYRAVAETLEQGLDASLEDRARWWAGELELAVDPERQREMDALGARVFADLAQPDADPGAKARLLRAAEDAFQVRLRTRPAGRREDLEAGATVEIRTGVGHRVAGSEGTSDGVRDTPTPGTGPQAVTLPDGRPGRGLAIRVESVGFPDEAQQDAWTRIRGKTLIAAHAATIYVARDTEAMDGFLRTLGTVLVLLIAALLALGLLLAERTVRRALRPLDRLRREIAALDAPDRRVSVADAPSDLEPVIDTLNAQLERQEEAFERERRTTAHIAHELRTPIAEIRSLAEVALQFPDDAALAAESLAGCRDAAAHMTRIVETVLRLARARTEASEAPSEPADLGALLPTVVARFEGEVARKGQDVVLEAPDRLLARAEMDAVEALLVNLMENAVRHAPSDSRIRMAARETTDAVEIEIENTCTTLEVGDLSHLVEPFWRKEAARTTSEQGGLGLTLADALARGIGAPLAFALDGESFVVRVRLPRLL